jgi:hypothetical protein
VKIKVGAKKNIKNFCDRRQRGWVDERGLYTKRRLAGKVSCMDENMRKRKGNMGINLYGFLNFGKLLIYRRVFWAPV